MFERVKRWEERVSDSRLGLALYVSGFIVLGVVGWSLITGHQLAQVLRFLAYFIPPVALASFLMHSGPRDQGPKGSSADRKRRRLSRRDVNVSVLGALAIATSFIVVGVMRGGSAWVTIPIGVLLGVAVWRMAVKEFDEDDAPPADEPDL